MQRKVVTTFAATIFSWYFSCAHLTVIMSIFVKRNLTNSETNLGCFGTFKHIVLTKILVSFTCNDICLITGWTTV